MQSLMQDRYDADVAIAEPAPIDEVSFVSEDVPLNTELRRNRARRHLVRFDFLEGREQAGDMAVGLFSVPSVACVGVDRVEAVRRSLLDADRRHPRLRLVARDDLGRRERMVGGIGSSEGMPQFRFQPSERFLLCPLFVAPDQIADVFADVLIGAGLADVRSDEVAECSAETDRHRRRAGHGCAVSMDAVVFNITKNAYSARFGPCHCQPMSLSAHVTVGQCHCRPMSPLRNHEAQDRLRRQTAIVADPHRAARGPLDWAHGCATLRPVLAQVGETQRMVANFCETGGADGSAGKPSPPLKLL